MCMVCDGMSRTEIYAWLRHRILEEGWAWMHVEGDGPRNPAFAYTVGLWRYEHPELVVFGEHCECNGRLLNTVAAAVAAGRRLAEGHCVDDLFGPDAGSLLLEFPDSSTHLKLANGMYRAAGAPPLQALQIVFCGPEEPR